MPIFAAVAGIAGALGTAGTAAAIGGLASVGGALISSHAAGHASDVAAQAAAQNNALQEKTYEENKALIQPNIDKGNAAGDELQGFLGLGGDPAKINAAFNDYLNSTGYQFDRNQGMDAVTQNAATRGMIDSGTTLKDLNAFGTGEAQKYGQSYIGNLNDIANRGQSGITALVGAGQNNANQQSSNNAGAANVAANAAITGGVSTNNLIANAVNAFGASRGQSSYNTGGGNSGGGNAFGGWAPLGG